MKRGWWTLLMLVTAVNAAPRAIREHVDIHWTYDEQDGWTCLAKTEPDGGDFFEELDDVYFPIDDAPVPAGMRDFRPEEPSYDFTGVGPGDSVWVTLEQGLAGQVWVGFDSPQTFGMFGSYQETDLRLSQADRDMAQPWIKITLVGVTYQGAGSGAFSLWRENSVSSPSVWFSTSDNTQPDTYLFQAGSHTHVNWGFAAPGIYRVRLTASAYLGPGQSNPTPPSPEYVVTFAVGDFAQWQASHFTGAELESAAICGPEADPDGDGMKNLVEFGFGLDPRKGTAAPLAEGLGLPKMMRTTVQGVIYETLEYPRRRAGEQLAPLIYTPQFSANLQAASWGQAGVITEVTDFPAALDSLNPVWEKVTSKRSVGGGSTRGFGRVMLQSEVVQP